MKRLFVIAALALVGVAIAAPAASADETADPSESSPLERVSAYVQPSVVYLLSNWTGYVYDTFNKEYLKNARPFQLSTQCTGYVVNPDGYIATAGHCVDPKGDIIDAIARQAAQFGIDTGYYQADASIEEIVPQLRVEGLETKNKGPDRAVTAAWGVSAGGVQTGKSYNARVVKFQAFDKGDAAILKVEATDLQAIEVADESELEVGTAIVSIGYPASVDLVTDQSFSPSFKDGSVSSEKTIQDGLLTVYEISAAVSGGMSGGPTVDLDGTVVAFNSFKIDPSVESQQFNFVRPTSIINELMADAGVDNELGDVSVNYRAGLDAYFAGDKEEAVAALEAVVDDQPTNTLAAEFLSKAEDLPDAAPAPAEEESDSGGGFPVVPVAIAAGVVLLLLVIGGVLMARRGKGGRGTQPAAPSGPAPTPAGGWASPSGAPTAAAAAPAMGMPAGPTRPAPVTAQAPPVPPSAGFQGTSAEPAPSPTPQPEPPAAASAEQHATFCTSCGTRANAGAKFCGHCGATLS